MFWMPWFSPGGTNWYHLGVGKISRILQDVSEARRSTNLLGGDFKSFLFSSIYLDRWSNSIRASLKNKWVGEKTHQLESYCWMKKSGVHQLRLIVYPMIYRVLAPSQVVVWDFFHQQYDDLLFICVAMVVFCGPSRLTKVLHWAVAAKWSILEGFFPKTSTIRIYH